MTTGYGRLCPTCGRFARIQKRRRPWRLPDRLREAVAAMPERERQLLELRYGEGLLMREVAARLQISTARVAQLLARAEYRLARRVVYPGLDVMQRFEKREVPSGLALGEEPPRAPRTGPMTVRLYESRDPVPTQAPLGSLEDLLSALDRFPLEQRAELLQRASERILQETAEGES